MMRSSHGESSGFRTPPARDSRTGASTDANSSSRPGELARELASRVVSTIASRPIAPQILPEQSL